ncbi:MAG TPA: phosphatidylserine decarboxylase [Thermoanaerobaculia bacterium]|nr:phosphatidylserine decarboxylase [Thermoanaerobaculia bacterium]
MKFAPEAWPFVVPAAAVGVVLTALREPRWALAAFALALLLLLFFRDPRRRYAGPDRAVLSAADGLITAVDRVAAPEVGPGEFERVVTFLSVFDVHVQKTPVAGRVIVSRHAPGRKLAAYHEAAGEVNEQHLTVIETPAGDRVAIRQIAGLLARRVVCYLREGQTVGRGEPMGLIKFGSRVDVLVPEGRYRLGVARGDRLKNGLSVIAQPVEDSAAAGESAAAEDETAAQSAAAAEGRPR